MHVGSNACFESGFARRKAGAFMLRQWIRAANNSAPQSCASLLNPTQKSFTRHFHFIVCSRPDGTRPFSEPLLVRYCADSGSREEAQRPDLEESQVLRANGAAGSDFLLATPIPK